MLPTVVPQRCLLRDNLLNLAPPGVIEVAVGVVSGVVLLPLAAQAVLGLIGFGAIGIVAGELHTVTRPHIM